MKRLKGNCLVAQSGGPTSVINSSAYGVIKEFLEFSSGEKIYAGAFGIEGILQKKIIDITNIDENVLNGFKYLPSAGLGSCRYKLKNFEESPEEYEKLFNIFKEYNIKYFFYIGGNDSMDAAHKLSEYAQNIKFDINILGIPKTIDNDLVETDHCPGYGSAAKYVANVAGELWQDISSYDFNSVVILETMGRDTGWIAASTGIIKKSIPNINHLIYVPEIAFSEEKFLKDVRQAIKTDGKLIITTSEGLRDVNGEYINANADANCYEKDAFGHKQLGGIGKYLQQLIKNNIEKRVKLIELGISQRCAIHCASDTDIEEAAMVGEEAVKYALQDNTGYMVALKRDETEEYKCSSKLVKLKHVCNEVKNLPVDWMDRDKNNINDNMMKYISPLIIGEVKSYDKNGLIKYVSIDKKYV